MWRFVNWNLPDIFNALFVKTNDRNVQQQNVRNTDELYVPYARHHVRRFSLEISGTNCWIQFQIT